MPVFHREKAIELAARLLWLAGTSVSAFRLLLLLYLAERAFLLRYAERFTGSSAEALPDGPMLTDVAALFSGEASRYAERFTGSSAEALPDGPMLTDVAALFSGEASPAADGFARGPHGLRLATTCKPSFDHLSAADIETADSIWAQFGKLSEAELKVLLQNGLCPEWQSGVTATITDTQILVAGGKTPREIAAFLENLKKADDLATVQQKLI